MRHFKRKITTSKSYFVFIGIVLCLLLIVALNPKITAWHKDPQAYPYLISEIRSETPIRTLVANNVIYNGDGDEMPIVRHDSIDGIYFRNIRSWLPLTLHTLIYMHK